jgi:hypothetical protein
MPDFDQYVMRHGESWVQWVIEGIERGDGVRANADASLEERWVALMTIGQKDPCQAA